MEGYTIISSKKVKLSDIREEQQEPLKLDTLLEKNGVEEIPSSPATIEVVDIPCSPLPIEVVDIPCSPIPIEVIEIPCSPASGADKDDEIVELLSDDDDYAKANENSTKNSENAAIPCAAEIDYNNVDIGNSYIEEEGSLEVVGYLTNNNAEAPIEPGAVIADSNFQSSFANDSASFEVVENKSYNSTSIDFGQCDQNNSFQLSPVTTTSNELYVEQNDEILNEAADNGGEYFTIDFIESTNNSNDAIFLSDDEDAVQEDTGKSHNSETEDASENEKSTAIYRRSTKVPHKESIDKYLNYLCPQCGLRCDTLQKWRLHTDAEHAFGLLETANMQSIVNKHGKLCHKCRDCPKMFDITVGFSFLINHRIRHLPYRRYICCSLCQKQFPSKTSVKTHLMNVHKELKITNIQRCQDSALDNIRFFCTVCKEEQANVEQWKTHMRNEHDYFSKATTNFQKVGEKVYACETCLAKVRFHTLTEHTLTHEAYKSFLCKVCNVAMTQLKAAIHHVRVKHLRTPNELLQGCSLCPATFKNLNARRKHYVEKHKVILQTCKVCKKSFNSTSLLLSHMNTANHISLKSRT